MLQSDKRKASQAAVGQSEKKPRMELDSNFDTKPGEGWILNDRKLMIADNCYKNRYFDTHRGNLLSVCFHVKIRKACSYTGRKRAAVPLRVRVSQSIFQFISIIFSQFHNSTTRSSVSSSWTFTRFQFFPRAIISVLLYVGLSLTQQNRFKYFVWFRCFRRRL